MTAIVAVMLAAIVLAAIVAAIVLAAAVAISRNKIFQCIGDFLQGFVCVLAALKLCVALPVNFSHRNINVPRAKAKNFHLRICVI